MHGMADIGITEVTNLCMPVLHVLRGFAGGGGGRGRARGPYPNPRGVGRGSRGVVSGPHKGGHSPRHRPGASRRTHPPTGGGGTVPNGGLWAPGCWTPALGALRGAARRPLCSPIPSGTRPTVFGSPAPLPVGAALSLCQREHEEQVTGPRAAGARASLGGCKVHLRAHLPSGGS